MLSLMRKHAQSWIIKIALFAVAIVFIFWGVGSFRSDRAARVATVDGKSITMNEFQQAYQQSLQRLQEAGGGRLDEQALKEMKMKQRVLDSLVDQRILSRWGKEYGFQVTPDELARKIQQIPAFQENGRFSPTRYERLLRANRITPEAFETEQASEMLQERIRSFVNAFVKVDPEEIRDFFAYLSDEMKLFLVRFDPDEYRKKITPDADRLRAFFEKNRSRYQTPLQVRISYLEVNPQLLEGAVNVSDQELQSAYQQNASRFVDPRNKQPQPFDQVRDEIRRTLVRERAREIARQKAEDLYDQLLLVGDLKSFGQKASVSIQETGWLTYGQPGSGLEGNSVFLDKAFALKKREISTVQDLGEPWGLVILQAVDRKETQPMSFEQAESRVRQDWLTEQAGVLARDAAEKFLQAVRGGKDWRILAREANLPVEETPFFSRFKNLPSWAQTPENLEVVFTVGTGHPYPEKVVKIGSGYGFIAFKEYRAAPQEELNQQQDRLAMILRQQKSNRLWEDWTRQLRQKAQIKMYQELN